MWHKEDVSVFILSALEAKPFTVNGDVVPKVVAG